MYSNNLQYASYPSLKGKKVLITGGATGIGAAIVRHFVHQGSNVAFMDCNCEAAGMLVQELQGNVTFTEVDLRDIEALEGAFASCVDQLQGLSVLINNAGNDDRHATDRVDSAYWDDRVAVNLKHVFFSSKLARSEMKKSGGGSIVNFGSITWRLGTGDLPVYAISKAALLGATKVMARECGVDKIRVNMISPGWVMTERQIKMWLSNEGEKILYERQCLKEKLMPEDIARVALWLASDDSRLVTNQEFIIDGGWW
jgi:NAD(P)-dependent dehydrogenase (short-subunit alcohol dehydrogenase family)